MAANKPPMWFQECGVILMTFTNHASAIRKETTLREEKAWRKAVLASVFMQRSTLTSKLLLKFLTAGELFLPYGMDGREDEDDLM